MSRTKPTVCAEPGCPNLTPCELHARTPWAGSTRSTHIKTSGQQRKRDNARIMRRHHGICHWCGRPGADVIDHVTPLAEGGRDTDANKAPIHSQPCHQQKTAAEASRARARAKAPGG